MARLLPLVVLLWLFLPQTDRERVYSRESDIDPIREILSSWTPSNDLEIFRVLTKDITRNFKIMEELIKSGLDVILARERTRDQSLPIIHRFFTKNR